MVSEGLRLLGRMIGAWMRDRALEIALISVALVFFGVALIIGAVAVHQALVPIVGLAWATAIIAAMFLLFALIALVARANVRRRRRRVARATNWSAAVPKPGAGMLLAALAAGAVLGAPGPRRR
jgi:hypothetical protein